MRTSQRLALCTAGLLIGLTSCDASKPVQSASATPASADDKSACAIAPWRRK